MLHGHSRRVETYPSPLGLPLLATMRDWVAPVLLSPFIGSFLGVLIVRLPEQRPVAMARSACDRCGHRLGARDLIPLVSYALSRGRCRYCGETIGPLPLAVELAALALAIWAAVTVEGVMLWASCLLGWTLLALAWIDARTMILPDILTLPLLLAGLIVTELTDPDSLADHATAAGLGYLGLFAVAWCYRRFRGRDGLGMGDAKLLGAIGAWLGLSLLPITLFLAACLGLLAAGAGRLTGRRMTAATAMPFGPFLAVAAWLLWLYADSVDVWFMN
jgi:leader peptidase (prepilin peptidase) / N-methyltransferase